MSIWFTIVTVVFIVVSAAMVLIILVQRPQGGGLAGAFGGAGASGTETVFGGRVGDALTVMTVIAFVLYLVLAVGLNLMDTTTPAPATPITVGGPAVPTDTSTIPADSGTAPVTTPAQP
jgi:preprotein translocase subunit SecG